MSAQTVTISDTQKAAKERAIVLTIKTATGGGFSYTLLDDNGIPIKFSGYLVSVEVVPGSATPSTGHSIKAQNARATDLLGGAGASIDTTVKTILQPLTGTIPVWQMLSYDTITIVIAAAGDDKTMTVVVNIHQP